MKDLKNSIAIDQSLAPAAVASSADGSTVDKLGYTSMTAVVSIGAWTDADHAFSLEDSPDDSTWTAVAASEMDGTFTDVTDATTDGTTQIVAYLGSERYLRVVTTVTNNPTDGCVYGANIIKGHPNQSGALAWIS